MISCTRRYLSVDTRTRRYTERRIFGSWTFQSSLFTSQHTHKVRSFMLFFEGTRLSPPFYIQRLRMRLESWALILSETESIFELPCWKLIGSCVLSVTNGTYSLLDLLWWFRLANCNCRWKEELLMPRHAGGVLPFIIGRFLRRKWDFIAIVIRGVCTSHESLKSTPFHGPEIL